MTKRYLISEMDQNVKRMLKLIEEDGDSFVKKAEMYYKKRPELINLVEEFYRMYRSLAERYDHVSGECRKNIPSDLQSQGSCVSDIMSEPPSTCPSPPDHRLITRRRSGPPRAAGFDFFHVAISNNSELLNKDGDEISTLDSEYESDDSSVINYVPAAICDEDQGLRRRIAELELEIREMQEKHRLLQEEIFKGSSGESRSGNFEVMSTLAGCEQELKVARKKIRSSEGEINRLKDELQKYTSFDLKGKDFDHLETSSAASKEEVRGLKICPEEDPDSQICCLEEEVSITKAKLIASEREVALAHLSKELQSNGSSIQRLKDQLGLAQKEISDWKSKLEKEKMEVSKLQDRILRYKSNLADRDQEIRGLKEAISNANMTLSEENTQLQAEIGQLLKVKEYLEDNIKEMDLRCQSLEADVRQVKAGKVEIEALLRSEIGSLEERIEEKNKHIEDLNNSLDELEEICQRLYHLRVEHVEVIDGAEKELRFRVGELEHEVERQQEVIEEGAEEKREAIRQLCFSLEHYRNGYHMLRKAVIGNKHPALMAS